MKWLVLAGFGTAGLAIACSIVLVAGAATQAVSVQDNQYVDGTSGNSTTTITAGDTVLWTWAGADVHTVENNGGSETFVSGSPVSTGTFSHTFNTPGTFDYVCGVHGPTMAGRVIVNAAAVPTDTPAQPSSTPVPEPTNTPDTTNMAGPAATSTSVLATTAVAPTNTPAAAASSPAPRPAGAALPATGSGGTSGDSSALVAVVLVFISGLLAIAGAGLAWSRRSA